MTQFVECQVCQHTISASDRHCSNCGAEVRPVLQEMVAPGDDTSALLALLQRATLGEYEIREELGRGGMAVVYLAHEIRFGRKVALKVLAPHLQLVQGMPARFLREAQTAANLEHPNIIPIYAYRESKDFAFFTMRFVAGAPLSALARQLGQLPVQVVRALVYDIGSALSFAHQHGVMHRDVKPGNVLIGRDGSVVVTDFGIAKQAEVPGLTLTGQLLGTPRYMSPEQCRGHEVTPASDQYSLGTMAFELLAGQPPFVGTSAMDIMAKQMLDPIPDLRAIRPDCPSELADALTRMLAKQPNDRFPWIDDALAAAGAMPVFPNDPVRLQLRSWVQNPVHERTYAITPVSPTPHRPQPPQDARTPATPVPPALQGARAPTPSTPTPSTPTPSTPTPVASVSSAPSHESVPIPRPPSAPEGAAASPAESGERPAVREAAAFPVTERRGVRAKWVRLALAGAVALLIVATLVRYGANQPGADEPPPVPELAATLVVNGLPSGTKVELDGRVASGPRLQLAAGRHALRLTAPGFVPMDTVLDIVAGTRLSFAFNGTPAEPPAGPPTTLTGTLHVRRLPSNGTITVDGKPMSGTSLALAAGEHRVRMEAPGYTSFEHTVTVAAGKSQALTFGGRPIDVEPSPGQTPQPPPLPSTSTPGVLLLRVRPFAKVFVDDRLATEDAMLVRSLSAGQHRLRFEKDGYVTLDSTIEILAGDTLKIAFVLEPRAR